MTIPQLYQLFIQHPSISTDTRKILPGSMFFALHGEKYNGNDFAENALAEGAANAIVDDASLPFNDKFILVKDVLTTLQDLASYHRNQFSIPVIAITGTNGKTTTKELCFTVLSQKYRTIATAGNFNNHIGVPLTLLSIKKETEIAIIEMGANHCGEIGFLCNLAKPDFGIITNIGKAHLEGFGSFEGVVKTKTELYNYLKQQKGTIFINIDNKLLVEHADGINSITYGTSKEADVFSSEGTADPYVQMNILNNQETIHIHSHLFGIYNAENILAAACIGYHFGVPSEDIQQAINSYQPENNRSQIIQTKHNELILDAYNANPTSMELAIRSFSVNKAINKVLILGDMLELGAESEKEHRHILDLLLKLGFHDVYLVGSVFTKLNTERGWLCFNDSELVHMWLEHHQILDTTILIKGSRGIKLETLVDVL